MVNRPQHWVVLHPSNYCHVQHRSRLPLPSRPSPRSTPVSLLKLNGATPGTVSRSSRFFQKWRTWIIFSSSLEVFFLHEETCSSIPHRKWIETCRSRFP